MAVAGNTVDAIMLRADNLNDDGTGGRLVTIGKHRIGGHLACDPDKAIRELRDGRACYLKLYADNLAKVQAAFAVTASG